MPISSHDDARAAASHSFSLGHVAGLVLLPSRKRQARVALKEKACQLTGDSSTYVVLGRDVQGVDILRLNLLAVAAKARSVQIGAQELQLEGQVFAIGGAGEIEEFVAHAELGRRGLAGEEAVHLLEAECLQAAADVTPFGELHQPRFVLAR